MSYFKPKISHCLSYCCGHPLPPPPPPPQSSILLIIITTITVLTTKIWAQLTFKCCLACHCTCSGFYRLLVSWPSFKNCPRTERKKHCWMCELLFIRPAKCLYRVPCTLQKHNILYDCMWKQIKLPSKWRCCWIRVSRRSCCWSCKIKKNAMRNRWIAVK